jgi:hypothetical protein
MESEDDMLFVPGGFAMKRSCQLEGSGGGKRSRSSHTHDDNCFHPNVTRNATYRDRSSCAAAQILNAIPESLRRFTDNGTLLKPILQAKVTVAQVLTPRKMATGELQGLRSAMASILNVPASFVDFGALKRGDKSDEVMNADLVHGADTKRALRSDKYERQVPYNYFHHKGNGPDFCSLVEPNKSMRTQWKGKKFVLGGERRGTCAALAEDYRLSETAHQ